MNPRKVEESKARKNDDLLMEDELAAAFLDDDLAPAPQAPMAPVAPVAPTQIPAAAPAPAPAEDNWENEADDLMGQLAVDVFETEEELIVKARTAGVDRKDLDVRISDGILTISGTLSSGDETEVKNWHIQECYWGEFSRTLALPVAVKDGEDDIKAELKDGVLTITFEKIKQEKAKKIQVL